MRKKVTRLVFIKKNLDKECKPGWTLKKRRKKYGSKIWREI